MSKHTPGPWYHTGREFNDVRDSDDELVAVALHLRVGQPERSLQEAEANARLISAAPDLLEALELMYACYADPSWISHKQQEDKIHAQVRSAIAKATGGSA